MSLSKPDRSLDLFDSFVDECIRPLKKMEEVLSLIGILFVGKVFLGVISDLLQGIYAHFISRLFRKNLVNKYGKWAVVTGCTDGIGKAYMEELAKRGMNIVLISRNPKKLEDAASDVREKYNVETEIVQTDFLKGRDVYKHIEKALENKEIGILVNNVGVMLDEPKYFHNAPDDEIWSHINLNIASVPAMTKLVIPGMINRRKGAIINMSSSAAYGPMPYMGIYAASKSFVEYFSDASDNEYKQHGITFQTVIPFYISTKMVNFSSSMQKPSFFVPSAETFAKSAINTLGYSTNTTGYWPHGIQRCFIETVTPKYLWTKGSKVINILLSSKKIRL